jgi:hypothetical protein
MTRAWTLIAGVGALAITLTACRIPSPLTYPLQLTPPVDATDEVLAIIGPPPPATTSIDAARHFAAKLTRQMEGCEVVTIGQVIWVEPSDPAKAAVEARGLCDDAVSGVWYEVEIEGDDQLGWVVARGTRQDICGRGVSGGLCV